MWTFVIRELDILEHATFEFFDGKQGEIEVFDEGLWDVTVETVMVNLDGTLFSHWKDGNESALKG